MINLPIKKLRPGMITAQSIYNKKGGNYLTRGVPMTEQYINRLKKLGISHLTRSGSRATAIDLVAVALFTAWPMFLKVWAKGLEWPWLENFEASVPSSVTLSPGRQSFTPLFTGGMHLLVLGLTYLMLGHAVFRRRDA